MYFHPLLSFREVTISKAFLLITWQTQPWLIPSFSYYWSYIGYIGLYPRDRIDPMNSWEHLKPKTPGAFPPAEQPFCLLLTHPLFFWITPPKPHVLILFLCFLYWEMFTTRLECLPSFLPNHKHLYLYFAFPPVFPNPLTLVPKLNPSPCAPRQVLPCLLQDGVVISILFHVSSVFAIPLDH